MNGLHIYEDMDVFEDIFGDLDLTVLHSREKHEVFVYGTLMAGMRNHHRIESDEVKLISNSACTSPYESLHMSTRITQSGYPAPIVVVEEKLRDEEWMPGDPGCAGQIQGEVYEVSNSILIYLDLLEGHPEVYRRELIPISTMGRTIIDTWMYLYTGEPTNRSDHITRTTHIGGISYKWMGE
jgi:gamma-glutamylcyclotransferase (GGCT)/AIG2-like uncharacterized protein YtfP